MTHVSSKELDPVLLSKLFDKLVIILGKAGKSNGLSLVVNELFTSAEKIMFTKRISIILMLLDKVPQHRIVGMLQVSPTTVSKISLGIEIGNYKHVEKLSKVKELNVEKLVWSILTAGGIMPPKIGRKYWTRYAKI